MNLQPTLIGKLVRLEPLLPSDFEELYHAASDPLIWEQHPDNARWKRDVFQTNFFKGAIESKGAFKIIDQQTNAIIGSTRFYDYNPEKKELTIGFTFLQRAYWGTEVNAACKHMLLSYCFDFVETALFVVGKENFRSQKAMLKLGAVVAETSEEKIIFAINREHWNPLQTTTI
jgi:RimJ/RimL family protein N-acetyltransferase